MKLSRYYDNYSDMQLNADTEIWSLFEQDKQAHSDTTTNVTLEFSFDKTVGENKQHDRKNRSSRSSMTGGIGTVPERTSPLGYSTIYPLLSMSGQRNWNVFMPYCIDMPGTYGGGEIDSGFGPCHHSGLTICLALVMNNLLTPNPFFWFAQPHTQTDKTSTMLTQFLKELSDDIGYSVGVTSGGHLPWDNIQTVIPTKMAEKYLLNVTCLPYSANSTGLDQISSNLQNYNPIILATKGSAKFPLLGGPRFLVIDGIAELATTVTIKKNIFRYTCR